MPSISHQEYLRKKKNKKLLRYGVLCSIPLLFIGLVVYLAHRPAIRISTVDFTGTNLVSAEDAQKITLDYLSGSYLWLFPKNNSFWYPHSGLEAFLLDSFKRIDAIHIERKGLTGLAIIVTERKPEALWCDDTQNCFFMDINGLVFAEAPSFSGDAYFRYYGSISVSDPGPIGLLYTTSTQDFSELSSFVHRVSDFFANFSLKSMYLVDTGEGDFTLTLSSGTQIYFDRKQSLSATLENLSALLKTDALIKNISRVDYIDLRFGNKLYYKLK